MIDDRDDLVREERERRHAIVALFFVAFIAIAPLAPAFLSIGAALTEAGPLGRGTANARANADETWRFVVLATAGAAVWATLVILAIRRLALTYRLSSNRATKTVSAGVLVVCVASMLVGAFA